MNFVNITVITVLIIFITILIVCLYKSSNSWKIFQEDNISSKQKYQRQLTQSELSSMLNETSVPFPRYIIVGKMSLLNPRYLRSQLKTE